MNQRIKELAQEVFSFKYKLNPNELNPDHNMDHIHKFAELIVRECVNVALEQKKWVEDQEVFNPQDESWNRARIQQSQRIVDKINEHFGVKE